MSQGEGGGPKTKFRAVFVEQARKMFRLGATEREVADILGVSESTFRMWKLAHPKLSAAVKVGKAPANSRTEMSLFHRANGYTYDAEELVPYDHTEIKKVTDKEGLEVETIVVKEKRVLRVPIVKHVPPDTTAIIFFLKNRLKDRWRDFKATELSTPPGRPFEIAPGSPGEPELIGAYYRRLAVLTTAGSADPPPDPGVGADRSESDESGSGEGADSE